jgi:hypothetical protein
MARRPHPHPQRCVPPAVRQPGEGPRERVSRHRARGGAADPVSVADGRDTAGGWARAAAFKRGAGINVIHGPPVCKEWGVILRVQGLYFRLQGVVL